MPLDSKTADEILTKPAVVSEGQTISDVIDLALNQYDPTTLKALVDLRQQTKVEAATASILSALPTPELSALATILTYANDGVATDQWHEALRAANEALGEVNGGGWLYYLKSLLDLHKSARVAVPGLEVMK